jgi:hypothetical protein
MPTIFLIKLMRKAILLGRGGHFHTCISQLFDLSHEGLTPEVIVFPGSSALLLSQASSGVCPSPPFILD